MYIQYPIFVLTDIVCIMCIVSPKRVNKYDNNPLSLRNGLIHNEKEMKTRTECVKILMIYVDYISRVFYDLNFYFLLKTFNWTNLISLFKQSDSPIAKELANKDQEVIKNKIIDSCCL